MSSWIVKIPGSPDMAADTAMVAELAAHRTITRDTPQPFFAYHGVCTRLHKY